MGQASDKIMKRVRALLAKADSTNFPDEADQLTAKAAELMARHGIEQALLGDHNPMPDKPEDRKVIVQAPYASVKSILFNGLAKALRCRVVRIERGRVEILHVFGFRTDLERLDVLYTSLLLQATHRMVRLDIPSFQGVRAYRRSWLLGFAAEAAKRVAAVEQAVQSEESGDHGQERVALVLADRETMVQGMYARAYPKTDPGRRISYSGTGYGQGRRDAASANIGTTGLGSRASAQIGQ